MRAEAVRITISVWPLLVFEAMDVISPFGKGLWSRQRAPEAGHDMGLSGRV